MTTLNDIAQYFHQREVTWWATKEKAKRRTEIKPMGTGVKEAVILRGGSIFGRNKTAKSAGPFSNHPRLVQIGSMLKGANV